MALSRCCCSSPFLRSFPLCASTGSCSSPFLPPVPQGHISISEGGDLGTDICSKCGKGPPCRHPGRNSSKAFAIAFVSVKLIASCTRHHCWILLLAFASAFFPQVLVCNYGSVTPLFFKSIPSDTKLLLTKNYSEIVIFGKIANLTRNSLKLSFLPGHFQSTQIPQKLRKIILRELFS